MYFALCSIKNHVGLHVGDLGQGGELLTAVNGKRASPLWLIDSGRRNLCLMLLQHSGRAARGMLQRYKDLQVHVVEMIGLKMILLKKCQSKRMGKELKEFNSVLN